MKETIAELRRLLDSAEENGDQNIVADAAVEALPALLDMAGRVERLEKLRQALKGTTVGLKYLMDDLDIDPETTCIDIKTKTGVVASVTFAELCARADAATPKPALVKRGCGGCPGAENDLACKSLVSTSKCQIGRKENVYPFIDSAPTPNTTPAPSPGEVEEAVEETKREMLVPYACGDYNLSVHRNKTLRTILTALAALRAQVGELEAVRSVRTAYNWSVQDITDRGLSALDDAMRDLDAAFPELGKGE